MTRIRFKEWLFAAVLVIALHGAALTGLAWLEPAPSGVRLPEKVEQVAVPADAVSLSVTVVGEAQPAPSQPPVTEAPASGSSNEIIVVPTEPAALPASPGQSTIVFEPPSAPAPQPLPEPEPAAEPEQPAVAALEPPPIEQASPDTRSDRSPLRDPVPQPKIKPGTEAETASPPAVETASPPAQAPTETAATNPAQPSPAQPSTDTQPTSAAQSTYYRLLLAQIKRAQRYPDDARREGKEGTVYLQIVVQRVGRIRSYDIVKSSGFQELDDAAVQTLVRANENLPPFPDEITDQELRFGLPIRFGS